MDTDKMPTAAPDFRQLLLVFGKIGLLSFGGPAGQIALMHRLLVEEKKWISDERFLHALNFCMLLPGPEAQQLATYSGWLLHGVRGGLVAGCLFILPGAVIMLALAALYVSLGDVPVVEGFLFGIKAAVLAVVLEALIRLSRRALKSRGAILIAVAAFLALAILHAPFPLVILMAGIVGFVVHLSGHAKGSSSDIDLTGTNQRSTVPVTLVMATLWAVPLILLGITPGVGNVFADQALFFSKMAVVTFGGAYAVLTYVAQQAVDAYGWIRPEDMLAGLGLAETAPGPLILVLVFVGFIGASRLSAFDPVAGGILGGFTALWFTFVPSFLWVFAGAPFIERLRHVGWLTASLAAVTAAVVGVIANLALWFGLQILFGAFETTRWGWFHVPALQDAALNVSALLIASGAALALMVFRLNLLVVLGLAAVAGIAFRLLA